MNEGLRKYQERENNKRMEVQQAESDKNYKLSRKVDEMSSEELVDIIVGAGFREDLEEILFSKLHDMNDNEVKYIFVLINILTDNKSELIEYVNSSIEDFECFI